MSRVIEFIYRPWTITSGKTCLNAAGYGLKRLFIQLSPYRIWLSYLAKCFSREILRDSRPNILWLETQQEGIYKFHLCLLNLPNSSHMGPQCTQRSSQKLVPKPHITRSTRLENPIPKKAKFDRVYNWMPNALQNSLLSAREKWQSIGRHTPWTLRSKKEPEAKAEQGEFQTRISIRKDKSCGWLSRSGGLSTRAYSNDYVSMYIHATWKIIASPMFISHGW
jgi:hypothetical protein